MAGNSGRVETLVACLRQRHRERDSGRLWWCPIFRNSVDRDRKQAITVGDAIADAPLVDSSAGKLYAFVTTTFGMACHGANAVYELSTNFTSIAGAGAKPVGTGGAGYYLYHGIFDNVYYSSATFTGNLYVVGNTGVAAGAILYRIPITSSVMGAPVFRF